MTLSAERVARRFQAAQLTKRWLMGIRRTWLKLLKPSVSSWDDIQAAIERLAVFVRNLKDEVFFTRRGPYTGTPTMTEGKKVEKLLNEVEGVLKEARSQARHWQEVAEGRAALPGFTVEQAERSLKGWSTDFEDAVSASIPGSITKILDKALKLLREDAQRVIKHDEANPDEPFQREEVLKEFHIGDMKFIMVLGPEDKVSDVVTYAGLLKKAHSIAQAKKLGHLWYGLCFLTPRCEKLDERTIKNYEAAGYDRKYIECRAGWYRYRDDTMAFTSFPTGGFVYGMMHELGHRHWYKFMSSGQRARYADLISSKAVDAVSDYGKSNPEEAFAEAFARYALGKDMTRDQMESFREVAFRGRSASMAERVARRFIEAAFLDVGDHVLYGKFKNARGKVVGFGKNEKGDPTVDVLPCDKDWKPKKGAKPKTLTLLKIRKVEKGST